MLKLTRPICVLDAETATAKDRPDPAVDRIICLAITKIMPDGSRDFRELHFNPGINITDENAAIHGYTNEKVKDWPLMNPGAAKGIQEFIAGCDLAGFNCINYDIPLLWTNLYSVGVTLDLEGVHIVDVGNIFKKKEERSLTAAVRFYCGKDHAGAHGAVADVQATIEVLESQVEGSKWDATPPEDAFGGLWTDKKYADLGNMTIAELAAYSRMDERVDLFGTIVRNKDGVPCFGTKRNQGVLVTHDIGYAEWILRSDFPENTKSVIENILISANQTESDDVFFE